MLKDVSVEIRRFIGTQRDQKEQKKKKEEEKLLVCIFIINE